MGSVDLCYMGIVSWQLFMCWFVLNSLTTDQLNKSSKSIGRVLKKSAAYIGLFAAFGLCEFFIITDLKHTVDYCVHAAGTVCGLICGAIVWFQLQAK